MATTVGGFLLALLRAWGVERIYGNPGDGVHGIMGALARCEDELALVPSDRPVVSDTLTGPGSGRILRESLRGELEEFLPHRRRD